jgi:hypothetical protein
MSVSKRLTTKDRNKTAAVVFDGVRIFVAPLELTIRLIAIRLAAACAAEGLTSLEAHKKLREDGPLSGYRDSGLCYARMSSTT